MRDTIYYRQVQLLIQVLPLIATEKIFALKGGTAINLFVRDMPRLSVDIDLVYLPKDGRDVALTNIRTALSRISDLITKSIAGSQVQKTHEQSEALRLIVQRADVRIKIEMSPVIRGTVLEPETRAVSKSVESEFGFTEMPIVSLPDLYAGKICAALDRQHPRDLFDVRLLLDNEGFGDQFRKTCLVYIISHQRPIAELLRPNRKDIKKVYESEFVRMTQVDIPVSVLENTREELITRLNETLTREEKQFLLSFKSKTPNWFLLGLPGEDQIANLPSVKWKQFNLQKMPLEKHKQALERLQQILHISLM
jgi:predicted nucleotidyltransferase component of viral defense system